MPWLKLDDGFPNNPKARHLSDRALRLYVHALCLCARNLTDGAIDQRDLKVLQAETSATRKHVDELHHAGLWDRTADGYLVHNYLKYNPSAEKVKEEREKARQRMGKNRARKAGVENDILEDGSRAGVRPNFARTGGRTSAGSSGSPSRPVVKSKPFASDSPVFVVPALRDVQ